MDHAWLGLRALRAQWRKPSLLVVLIGNLIPAVCVWLYGWSAGALLLIYWIENIVIGLVNLAKMIVGAAARREWSVLFYAPFFSFHYGLFCLGHGVFVVFLFALGFNDSAFANMDHPALLLRGLLERYHGVIWNAAALALVQVIAFIEWCARRGWRGGTVAEQMGEPYPRLFVLHITLIFGGLLLMLTNDPVWAVVVMGLLKTGYDVRATAHRLDGGVTTA